MMPSELYRKAVHVVSCYFKEVPKRDSPDDIFGDADLDNKLGKALAVEQAVIALLDMPVREAELFRRDVRR